MDDDGLLLNFDLSAPAAGAAKKAPKVVGGSWKARKAFKESFKSGKPLRPDGSDPNHAALGPRSRGRAGRKRELPADDHHSWPRLDRDGAEHAQHPGRSPKRQRAADGAAYADQIPHGFISAPPTRQTTRHDRNRHQQQQQPAGDGEAGAEKPQQQQPKFTPQSGPKQVVSSLFFTRPAPAPAPAQEQAQPAPEAQPAESLEPSNAPLTDEAVTFTNLGLNPAIANHLVAKMSIKAPTGIQKLALQEMLGQQHTESPTGGRDVFIRAETGSGKTLAYLLPLVERILRLRFQGHKVTRKDGLLAIILAPTRELCGQITAVLDKLLRCAVYIVAGSVNGGENKQKEKSRIRKGINILVATPGRLSDHLQNTKAFDVGLVRWLILDEGDRMMEMGFEDDIKKLLARLSSDSAISGGGYTGLPKKRINVLCSATMRMGAQKLGDLSLREAVHLDSQKADKQLQHIPTTQSGADGVEPATADPDQAAADGADADDETFLAPAQLQQWYVATPPKLRLVTLASLLRRAVAHGTRRIIVFFSSADSVDFHFSTLTRTVVAPKADGAGSSRRAQQERETAVLSAGGTIAPTQSSPTFLPAPILAAALATSGSGKEVSQVPVLHRLHGSLPHPLRRGTLHNFGKPRASDKNNSNNNGDGDDDSTPPPPSILLTTDLSSRGLDLPQVDLVIEVDPALSAAEHLHRIGRTARAGRNGRAAVLLSRDSAEMGYVNILQACMRPGQKIRGEQAESVIELGFGLLDPSGATTDPAAGTAGTDKQTGRPLSDWQSRATTFQLAVERWVLDARSRDGEGAGGPPPAAGPRGSSGPKASTALDLAKNAFQSHVRAYATHAAVERVFFNIKQLHLGHLCKAFGLRVAPSVLGVVGLRHAKGETRKAAAAALKKGDRKDRKDAGEQRRKKEEMAKEAAEEGSDDDSDGEMFSQKKRPGASLTATAVGSEEQVQEAKRKMRTAMKSFMSAGAVSEFNLG